MGRTLPTASVGNVAGPGLGQRWRVWREGVVCSGRTEETRCRCRCRTHLRATGAARGPAGGGSGLGQRGQRVRGEAARVARPAQPGSVLPSVAPRPGLGVPREAGRSGPHAFLPLPAPRPTVELEVADALALSVSGRGAAEAAPEGLTLAAPRPAAAREGHCQQPQRPHPRAHRGPKAPAAAGPTSAAGRGRSQRGRPRPERRRPNETNASSER